LEHAEQDFERKFGFRRGGKWAITVCNPVTTICLQAVDYFLWAVQRFYEGRRHPQTGEELPREDRFLKMLWSQIVEIHDLDFGRGTGTLGLVIGFLSRMEIGSKSSVTLRIIWPNFLLDIWHSGEPFTALNGLISEKEREISPAINMRGFSKLVT
jgi:hypothetical protein